MRRLAVIAISGSLLLAGCGSSDSKDDAVAASSPSASPSGTGAPADLPITTEVGFTAAGSYGDKPTLTFPAGATPGKALGVKVLTPGTGPVVAKGDVLVGDYLGQIWNGKVFDNSYDKGQGAAFPIGAGQVIPGWDKALVGQKVGSRVLLSIPPAEGYGDQGQAQAGIKGTDTIVFVVDIAKTYGRTSAGDPKAVAQKVTLPAGLTVTGDIGKPATLTAAKTYKAPAKAKATILAKGSGKPANGSVILQYAAAQPGGKSESSWESSTPQAVPVDNPQAAPFTLLKGVPIGSRVLLEVPADKASGRTEAVFVVDLVGVAQTAKSAKAAG